MVCGRKRGFEESKALQAAMKTFWQKGYTGASLSDLTENMGINKPSMYCAFGNKEELFVKATKLYIDTMDELHTHFLYEPDTPLKSRLKNYLMSILNTQCDSENPKGCYIVFCQSEAAGGDMPQEAGRILAEAGGHLQKLLEKLFLEDPEAKSLGLNDNARGKALCLATMLRGTASMARAGVSVSELEYVAKQSLNGIGIR